MNANLLLAAERSRRIPTAHVNGIRLHYEEHGEGRPVVFLHGALAVGMAFRGQRAALKDLGRLIFLDQRGHGASTHFGEPVNPWSAMSYAQLVADAHAFLDSIAPVDDVAVVGASMGGVVAARVASERPVRALALLSTPARASAARRAFFAETRPEDTMLASLAAKWHGEPYWRDLARGLFAHFAGSDDLPPIGPIRVPRALVQQAVGDELLERDEADVWASRIVGEVVVDRPPGSHAYFADGRAGTKAANAALRDLLSR